MSDRPAIRLSQVTKVYRNGTVALENLDLAVPESQFVSLVGPSGCGKSTVLQLMAGLGTLTSGQVEWADPGIAAAVRSRNAEAQESHGLAFVFQEAALMPWATVLENVCLPFKLAGVPPRKAAIAAREALHRVGLEGAERCYPRELSGGMKMRVSIARALVTRPKVLLMDEPFGALDEITRSRLNEDLLALWSEMRWTVVFVTHNIYEAVYLSNRVVVMAARPGRVVADIPIEAPYPRSESFRTSPLFNQYCRRVSAALAEAIAPSPLADPGVLDSPV
ncbi:ABC transporter ATP-binding protein [Geitlerinema sp. PCC 7407]|uniref:ABC transporter ATP-binding protein n=1 Tax=Geitlerinema sp. PCC 7407 TaxID=1173025 RepID=UPI00029FF0EF|nr:ABC transporter ATP-binding protein [Geitlerinema sp. PCC 7407]AFY65265.1 ABC transporter related protein [Geitlerinema sp. PCC 7407]